jgi:hypothetical protein
MHETAPMHERRLCTSGTDARNGAYARAAPMHERLVSAFAGDSLGAHAVADAVVRRDVDGQPARHFDLAG